MPPCYHTDGQPRWATSFYFCLGCEISIVGGRSRPGGHLNTTQPTNEPGSFLKHAVMKAPWFADPGFFSDNRIFLMFIGCHPCGNVAGRPVSLSEQPPIYRCYRCNAEPASLPDVPCKGRTRFNPSPSPAIKQNALLKKTTSTCRNTHRI